MRAFVSFALAPMNGWAYLFYIPGPSWEWYWRVPGAVFSAACFYWAYEAVRYWLDYRRERRLELVREVMET